ncbi:MAG: 2-C-methyl-D-erythritol 2,4-cyclodiphosphate synthase [Rhabdochlamydiaceae bacterium]|nr:2-C-methyl-D-erythritol 2,4-cyclodiphosphate synthase [Rhabdochlamydiaceae bacterium]
MERAFKLGYGYDSHRFLNLEEKKLLETQTSVELETEYLSQEKKLIIGGVVLEEKYQKAFGPFKARSDGDVLYHAVVNALLSALSNKKARDIGSLFPNNDSKNSNRNSADFVRKSAELLQGSSYELIDLKIMVKSQIRMQWHLVEKNLESFFAFQKIFPDIHVQATSGEEMDDAGKGLGVEVFVVCLLQNKTLQS